MDFPGRLWTKSKVISGNFSLLGYFKKELKKKRYFKRWGSDLTTWDGKIFYGGNN